VGEAGVDCTMELLHLLLLSGLSVMAEVSKSLSANTAVARDHTHFLEASCYLGMST